MTDPAILLQIAYRCEREEPNPNLDRDIVLGLRGLTATLTRGCPG